MYIMLYSRKNLDMLENCRSFNSRYFCFFKKESTLMLFVTVLFMINDGLPSSLQISGYLFLRAERNLE